MIEHVDLYRPVVSWVWLALLVGGAMAAVLWLYGWSQRGAGWFTRIWLTLWRIAALAALAWVLAGPSIMHTFTRSGRDKPTLVVLVDQSASMNQRDVSAGGEDITRYEAIQNTWLSPDTLADLQRVANIGLVGFDHDIRHLDKDAAGESTPTGKRTHLFDALRLASAQLQGEQADPATFLLLSDGHDTRQGDDPMLAATLRAAGSQLFAVPVGSTQGGRDLAVQTWTDQQFLFEGHATTLHAAVVHQGLSGRGARIEVFESGRLIESQQLTLAPQTVHRLAFEVRPPANPDATTTIHEYRVRATLLDDPQHEDDAVTDNNERTAYVEVSRERIRVALFEGQPYWDTRFLARVLEQDANIELTAVYQLGRNRTITVESSGEQSEVEGPIDDRTLRGYDVVILGRNAEAFFPGESARMLVDYVRDRGGALVMARGRPFSATSTQGRIARRIIEPISPVTWADRYVRELHLALTEAGRDSPLLDFDTLGQTDAILTRLPGMLAATRIESEKAASIVLLEQTSAEQLNERMAAVATMRVGRGQVMAVLGEGMWRWSMLPSRLRQYDSVYHLFWSRAIQWLATGGDFLPGQQVALRPQQLMSEPDKTQELVVETRYVEDERFEPVIRITDDRGEVTELQATRRDPMSSRYSALWRPTSPGVYRLEVSSPDTDVLDPAAPPTARVAVYDNSLELLDPTARPGLLKRLSEDTGGLCLGLDEVGPLIDHLQLVQESRQSEATAAYDFARWPIFAIIAAGLGVEWITRRRSGLV